ncbi:ABC transporter ATP-binding protein [Chelatococcus reniformis]|uniref:ABC transporter ATP-binding protein n=1 Tax=Chelatococcus reniformis TaxID=1494448 RepID=A0A916XD96_9HYPH|nr:ATP-binding cassette domain-containing protein [Chelatococcus reniformis]GGC65423.1 ABC transporter ATP-binding protein [Chelatococcus reniformis]
MTAQLELRNLSRHFGGIRAVDGVSFAIAPGRITGLVGPNGAGKSTLFNVVTGTIRPSGGTVLFEGRPLAAGQPGAMARRGLIRSFQSTMSWPELGVRRHLEQAALLRALAAPRLLLRRGRIAEARRRAARLADDILEFTGLAAVAEAPVATLPYGSQKIVGVAMALAAEPTLLLADEPAAGLNGAETLAMEALLRRIHRERGVSLVVVEHDLPMIMRLCDRLIALADGRVIADGTPAEVRRSRHFIEAYLGSDADAA